MISDLELHIEVPKWSSEAEDARGQRFEVLVHQYLNSQSYRVKERYRVTGSEIDLLCEHTLSLERLVVECKAKKDNVSSSDVNKIFTDLFQMEARLGYIFYISKLGKETDSKIDELNKKSSVRIAAISPDLLVETLVNSGKIKPPPIDTNISRSRELYLVLLKDKVIWVRIAIDERSGQRTGITAWDARTAEAIPSARCPDLTDTDWQYKSLPWLANSVTSKGGGSPRSQLISKVPESDAWADLLPSNPSDFVGRGGILHQIEDFLVRLGRDETRIRLFGIKGHSGWGKSSTCLKVADIARRRTYDQAFILPVDCRSAVDLNFPDLAFARLLQECSASGFFLPLFSFNHEFLDNPFVTESYQALFRELRETKRCIGIIFDQFEELIHRDDRNDLFQRLRDIALLVDDLKQPLFVGFSWKTDGSIASDNPGYMLWHSLNDRRVDFTISGFTRGEADDFISLAARREGKRITQGNKDTLIKQSSGYPWLLKKLTVRTFKSPNIDQLFASTDFSDNDLKMIFDEDLEGLSERERASLIYIAINSPIESYIVAENYGADALDGLLSKRIVVRSGNRISIYWDIFREYLVTGRIPPIPTTYVPTISGPKLLRSIRHTLGRDHISYMEFATRLAVSVLTADNFVRDLSHLGITTPHRAEGYFGVNVETEAAAIKRIFRFLDRHSVFKLFVDRAATGATVGFNEVALELREIYAFLNANEATLRSYFKRILSIATYLGRARRRGNGYTLVSEETSKVTLPEDGKTYSETEVFRAHAPVERVLALSDKLLSGGPMEFEELRRLKLRNAVYALNTLGLSRFVGNRVTLDAELSDMVQIVSLLRDRVRKQDTVILGMALIERTPDLGGRALGEAISDELSLEWSSGSCARYGSAIRGWLDWLSGVGVVGQRRRSVRTRVN